MDALQCIGTRHSCRKFADKEVTNDTIVKLMEVVKNAPTWKNVQEVRYYAVRNEELKKRIAEEAVLGFAYNTKTISSAPVLMVETVVSGISGYEKDGTPTTPQDSHWQSFDAGISAGTLELAAFATGLGSVIMGIYDDAVVKGILDIPDDQTVTGLIALGWPAAEGEGPEKKPVEDILSFRD